MALPQTAKLPLVLLELFVSGDIGVLPAESTSIMSFVLAGDVYHMGLP